MATIKFSVVGLDSLLKTVLDVKRNPVTRSAGSLAGKMVVDEMKRFISRGRSPIKGSGKFPRYKNVSRYPAGRKPNVPVNLRLTGRFLADLRSKSIRNGTEIFINSQESIKKEDGHRKGANSQPKRPIIPDQGETFTDAILGKAISVFEKDIARRFK